MKPLLRRLVMLIVALCLMSILIFAVLEISFRMYLERNFDETRQLLYTGTWEDLHEVVSVMGHPYTNIAGSSFYPEHNQQGYRNADILPKSPGTYRIITVGGSATYGFGTGNPDATYPAQLEDELQARGFDSIEVINAGVNSFTTWESLIDVAFRIIDLEPDLLLILQGPNDVATRLRDVEEYAHDGYNSVRGIWQIPERPLPASALYRLIAYDRGWLQNPLFYESYLASPLDFSGCDLVDGTCVNLGTSAVDLLEQNPPIYFERNMHTMVAIAQANDIAVMLSTSPYYADDLPGQAPHVTFEYKLVAFDEHNAVVIDLAGATDSYLYDLQENFPVDAALWHDQTHVNEAGFAQQASLYADYIEDVVLAAETPED